MIRILKQRILPVLIFYVFRAWSWTWRYRCVESAELKRLRDARFPVVFAHWHGDELGMLPLAGSYRIATMTSTSQDGSLIDYALHRFGARTSRGSSTRGGVRALIGLIRLMRQGFNATVAVDGPKGPLHQVKPGVFELATHANARIVPMALAASRPYVFKKSWNQAVLPLPFSKVVIFFSEPWPLLNDDTPTKDDALAHRLALELHAARQQAAQVIAVDNTQC